MIIVTPLLAAHVPGRDDPDLGFAIPKHESDVKQSLVISPPESVDTLLYNTMCDVRQHKQRLVEKDLLGFGLANIMLVGVLSGVSLGPIEAGNLFPIDHGRIFS
ncbi:hypothetical protein NGR_b09830 (plasmid) [Sinorhizobium fredii NGR234]|uniref:Uncharacterized protein n=1 Tax=Sinorhizobium fredii (strain NBRC 101917 / NGR234) TaxID=394 RepID=C3KQS8_SINFN|nr:hypothetical protein NGR_b09830 [Sinorhizobium fredii NGR234]